MTMRTLNSTESVDESRRRYIAKGVAVQNPICITRAQGAKMWDDKGHEYLDFAGGIGCLNVGSSHPEVVEAVKQQAERYFHTCIHVALNEPYVALAKALCERTPIQGEKKAVLLNSGAEAVENAVKIARSYTGRHAIVAFEYAFHGRTTLGLSLTSKVHPYKAGFGPFVPEVYRLPYAYCYRCQFGKERQSCAMECISAIVRAFDTYVNAHEVACVIVEPVQGEGGFIVPPPEYLPKLREICRKYGILFIVDEVQTGFGRTGKLFSTEHYDQLDPDMIVMAKSMGAGLPISAVVGRAEIMDSTEVGGLGGTYGGNPLAAAAALKVIEIMERDDLPTRAQRIGERCMAYLRQLQAEVRAIGDVRGQGAMVAMEFVKDRDTKEPDAEIVARISQLCLEKGLMTIKAGVWNNVIRLLPPLVISDEELDLGLAHLKEAVCEAAAELGP